MWPLTAELLNAFVLPNSLTNNFVIVLKDNLFVEAVPLPANQISKQTV